MNARNTLTFVGEQVVVSATTVTNRIEQLEDDGIICGYHVDIDYAKAGLPLQVLFVCSAAPSDRPAFAEQAIDIQGVVNVRAFLGGELNVRTTGQIEEVASELHDLGFPVVNSDIVHAESTRPWNQFQIEEDAE
ncbi:Lrp/AsnC family transcriptional regulator [Halomicrococcus gelatinilyticus]|uniref:Lrp/AsnC family transcriptional regulator n=1 Tax=Halomicrococcus gelatinilyticus TaxID=1702103 RepID=UPI002E11904F